MQAKKLTCSLVGLLRSVSCHTTTRRKKEQEGYSDHWIGWKHCSGDRFLAAMFLETFGSSLLLLIEFILRIESKISMTDQLLQGRQAIQTVIEILVSILGKLILKEHQKVTIQTFLTSSCLVSRLRWSIFLISSGILTGCSQRIKTNPS
jgi:hypothetical protein